MARRGQDAGIAVHCDGCEGKGFRLARRTGLDHEGRGTTDLQPTTCHACGGSGRVQLHGTVLPGSRPERP